MAPGTGKPEAAQKAKATVHRKWKAGSRSESRTHIKGKPESRKACRDQKARARQAARAQQAGTGGQEEVMLILSLSYYPDVQPLQLYTSSLYTVTHTETECVEGVGYGNPESMPVKVEIRNPARNPEAKKWKSGIRAEIRRPKSGNPAAGNHAGGRNTSLSQSEIRKPQSTSMHMPQSTSMHMSRSVPG